jgi:hypothetical protein
MLNPEGFRHQPGSKNGCVLFVKLRQHGGGGRRHTRLLTSEQPWEETGQIGVKQKTLYKEAGQCETMRLEKWAAETEVKRTCTDLTELFVISGELKNEEGESYPKYV